MKNNKQIIIALAVCFLSTVVYLTTDRKPTVGKVIYTSTEVLLGCNHQPYRHCYAYIKADNKNFEVTISRAEYYDMKKGDDYKISNKFIYAINVISLFGILMSGTVVLYSLSDMVEIKVKE